jgi:hypothetical protein
LAGGHGRNQVEGFRSSHLSDDQAIGPQPQRVADQCLQIDPTRPLAIGRPGLEADYMA